MKTETKHIAPWGLFICGWLGLAPLATAQSDEHAGHMMAAPVQDGPWSYKGRDNPKPYTQGRWEMVPSSKNGAQFIAADGLSTQECCALLRDNDYMAVDRATRAACGRAPSPAPAPATTSPADPHAGHQH